MKRLWPGQIIRRWIKQRIPPVTSLALSHRNVFILPSTTGWLFSAVLVAMLLTAINYQNSLIYALTFWLASMGLAALWLTFRNLSGLHLQSGKAIPCYAGDIIRLPVRLTAPRHWSVALDMGFPGNTSQIISLAPGETSEIQIPMTTKRRGRLPARRLRIQSRYPLGLFTCWSWVALEYSVIVYPAPEEAPIRPAADGDDPESTLPAQHGAALESSGIRDYRAGDSLSRIAWKHSARTDDLRTLEYEGGEGAMCWLSWDQAGGANPEQRLSRLCAWVREANASGLRFGLTAPGIEIDPDNGDAHLTNCLRALALWGDAGEDRRRSA